jgi:hypothetical protein
MRPLDTSRLSHALRRLALVGTLLLYGASRADAEWYIGGMVDFQIPAPSRM